MILSESSLPSITLYLVFMVCHVCLLAFFSPIIYSIDIDRYSTVNAKYLRCILSLTLITHINISS